MLPGSDLSLRRSRLRLRTAPRAALFLLVLVQSCSCSRWLAPPQPLTRACACCLARTLGTRGSVYSLNLDYRLSFGDGHAVCDCVHPPSRDDLPRSCAALAAPFSTSACLLLHSPPPTQESGSLLSANSKRTLVASKSKYGGVMVGEAVGARAPCPCGGASWSCVVEGGPYRRVAHGLSAVREATEALHDRAARLGTVRGSGSEAHVLWTRRVGMFELP